MKHRCKGEFIVHVARQLEFQRICFGENDLLWNAPPSPMQSSLKTTYSLLQYRFYLSYEQGGGSLDRSCSHQSSGIVNVLATDAARRAVSYIFAIREGGHDAVLLTTSVQDLLRLERSAALARKKGERGGRATRAARRAFNPRVFHYSKGLVYISVRT